MATVIAVVNYKGGVGKTTISCEVAVMIGILQNKRACVVDTDPSQNAARFVRGDSPRKPTGGLSDFMLGRVELKDAVEEGVLCDVLPADEDLELLPQRTDRQREISDGLISLRESSLYDYFVIDTPGYDIIQVEAAIRAAHIIIIPVWPDENSVIDAGDINIRAQEAKNAPEVWLLPNKFSGKKLDREELALVKKIKGATLLPEIRTGSVCDELLKIERSLRLAHPRRRSFGRSRRRSVADDLNDLFSRGRSRGRRVGIEEEAEQLPAEKVPLRLIDRTGRNPRRVVDDGLKESMDLDGQLQPVVLMRSGRRYDLIMGDRRLTAAEALGWDKIEARVFPAGHWSDHEIEIKMMTENRNREDPPEYDDALGIYRLKNRLREEKEAGHLSVLPTNARIAKSLGESEQWVKSKYTHGQILLEVDPKLTRLWLQGLSTAQVLEVRSKDLSKSEKLSRLKAMADGNTVRDTRKGKADSKGGNRKAASPPTHIRD